MLSLHTNAHICKLHGMIICLRQNYCSGNSTNSRFLIQRMSNIYYVILHKNRQELTSLIASTEREPITFKCQAWYGCKLHNIANMLFIMYTITMYRKLSKNIQPLVRRNRESGDDGNSRTRAGLPDSDNGNSAYDPIFHIHVVLLV